MEAWLFWLLFAPIFGVAMYLLYQRGYVVSKSIVAIVFIFHRGKDADMVTVDSCTGWVIHGGQFRESRIYEFTLDAQLTRGDVKVLLLNQKKMPLLRLNKWHPTAQVTLDGSGRYFLRWEFSHASGKCGLRW